MKIILSHPTGNANVRAVAEGMAKAGMLHRFYTAIAAYQGNIWYRLGAFAPMAEFRRRSFSTLLQPYTSVYPWRELGRAIATKIGCKKMIAHESGVFSVDQIYRAHDRHVSSQLASAQRFGATAVYAYEDGALETFTLAKKLGMLCIYDLPIAYWETGRKLMQEEAERQPKWAITLGGGIKDSTEKLERKRKELELADIVVGPGAFVMDSLPEWARNKHKIVSPFGSPTTSNNLVKHINNDKLRVLFVGSMGQRKGLGDLFEALKKIESMSKTNKPAIELVVLGSLLAPMEFYRSEYSNFSYEPSRPHAQVLELMRSCDVFCLPSIVEGRALVMQEAMSQGLPIIITPNTGGEDLVIEGETGFLVPIRSPQAIAEKIIWFNEHRDAIPAMSKKAQLHAANYSWEQYGETILNGISNYNKQYT